MIEHKCYHIWTVAVGGNGLFRLRKCYKSRSTANTTAKRGVYGDQGAMRVEPEAKKIVMQCLPDCPCGPGKREHNNI